MHEAILAKLILQCSCMISRVEHAGGALRTMNIGPIIKAVENEYVVATFGVARVR